MGGAAVGLQGLLPGQVLQRFAEQIFDKDGLTVQKTVEVPQLPSRGCGPVLGQGCRRARHGAVRWQGGRCPCCAGAVLAVMDVALIMQRQVVVLRTVEVPQIQFIAPICGHFSSQQRQVRTVQTVQLSAWVPFVAVRR